MAKTPTSKDVSTQAKSDKTGTVELPDDDLQEVTAGMIATHPIGPGGTGPTFPTGPTEPTGPTGPTGPVCISGIV
jgi:hypothetical protein